MYVKLCVLPYTNVSYVMCILAVVAFLKRYACCALCPGGFLGMVHVQNEGRADEKTQQGAQVTTKNWGLVKLYP